jgi:hypothetical protein
MRKAIIFLLLISLFPIASSQAAPSLGAKCNKLNKVRSVSDIELICKRSGKKLVWKIANPIPGVNPFQPDPRPSSPVFTTDCDLDPLVPKEWEEFQNKLTARDCAPPYRYVVKQLTDEVPLTAQTPRADLLPISQCKLQRSDGWNYDLSRGNKLNPNTIVQIVPFATRDYPANSNPQQDWKPYLDFIVDSLTKMTDVKSNYQFRIAPKYFYIDKNLSEYNLSGLVSHGDPAANPRRHQLANDVLDVADAEINFSDVNSIFFFSPVNVPRTVLANQIGWGKPVVTDEKTYHHSFYISSYINDFKSPYWNNRDPFAFIHELMHIFNTAEDYYGDVNYGGTGAGMGNWGNMSGGRTDHLTWDKWSAQMISDDQVRCADKSTDSTHWLKPSTISGLHEKMLMIPLNRFEAIIVESIRASGFNYKIPTKQHGAIVYRINTAQIDENTIHGDGAYIICPTNRACNKNPDPQFRGFRYATAALKLGDYVDFENIRISVVEAGDYGDVISVQKVNKVIERN